MVQAHLDYKSSARFDDEILVKTKVAAIGNSSIRFENEIYLLPKMKLLAVGHTIHVLTTNGEKTSFPAGLKSRFASS